ncbi:ring-opening amidohydrolase [Evansella cellulosilytica]|uniref:Cyclic amide hydrolase n=1 Tax=Evansella cellulosilytica (strain ATCC 21833 / DSM 2522 / FERM P-1141 / JCM 9156 / N-4) TaxID=649639 RepID=E6TRX5_EVAC2|nr:ring-opening amidohydrolase [Evansella cellulosilytica]ADU29498.1 ring-opening amidohydrolase [Evansella cellulosilytica DSM 2522]
MNYELIRCDMDHPGDVSALAKLLNEEEISAESIRAIIAQTEGDGYSRGYATLAFQLLLSEKLNISQQEVFDTIPMMMIGKTGGLMTPHYTLFIEKEDVEKENKEKRFSFGVASTRVLLPEEIGTVAQVDLVADAVNKAMLEAGIESIDDVKCVEVKCPWGVGGSLAKATSALGSAVALKEVDREVIDEDSLNEDHSLFSVKTSVSAGQEQVAARVIVMGNSVKSTSNLYIGSGVMKDALDLKGMQSAFKDAGINHSDTLSEEEQAKIVQVFVNAGADAINEVRGRRHTMHTDALAMHSGIVAKAVANAVVGSYVGETRILCSAGSEHQGPQGSNLVAAVIRVGGIR